MVLRVASVACARRPLIWSRIAATAPGPSPAASAVTTFEWCAFAVLRYGVFQKLAYGCNIFIRCSNGSEPNRFTFNRLTRS